MFGLFKSDVKSVHVNDMDPFLGKVQLIDIREPYEYNGGKLVGSTNIPMGNLLSSPEKYLTKEKEYYIVCLSGSRSSMTCRRLSKLGYNVINVGGGVGSYVGTKRK